MDNISNNNINKISFENLKFRIQKRIGYIFFGFILFMIFLNLFNTIFLVGEINKYAIIYQVVLFIEAIIYLWTTRKGHSRIKRIIQILFIILNGLLTLYSDIDQIYFALSFLVFGALIILQYDLFEHRYINYIIFIIIILVSAVFISQYYFVEEQSSGTVAPLITDPGKLSVYNIIGIITRLMFISLFLVLFPSIYIDQAKFFTDINDLIIKEKESLVLFANIGMMLNSTVHNFNNKIVTFLSSEYIITTTINKYKDILDQKDYQKIMTTCEMVKHSSDEMAATIKDLRNLIKDKTNSNLQTFEVNKITEDIVNQFKISYEKNNVIFNFTKKEPAIFVKGSSINFVQVIENIIKNAIESTKNPVIELESGIYPNPYIFIKDNGNGIPFCFNCKKIDCLNCKEFQIGKTTKVDGSGTGMVYVQNQLKNMGFKLKIESKEDEGTKVSIIFPQTITQRLEKMEDIYLDKDKKQIFGQT